MRQRVRELRAGDEGFTLIELLLVIIILGVLAAVVVFSVQGISDRGNASACRSTRASISSASEAFFAKKGSYPLRTADMTTAPDRFLELGDLSVTLVTPASGAPYDDIKGPTNGWELQIEYKNATTPPSFNLINCT